MLPTANHWCRNGKVSCFIDVLINHDVSASIRIHEVFSIISSDLRQIVGRRYTLVSRIMHLHIPAPQGSADEVGVVVSDSEVVDGGDFVEARDRFDRNQCSLAANEQIADL